METGISFDMRDGEVFANATEMCKAFGKKPAKFLERPTIKRYLEAIERKSDNRTIDHNAGNGHFVFSKKASEIGASDGGTWIHEKLILKLAQWLDVDFEVWCDDQIATLMREGSVSVQPQFEIPCTKLEWMRLAVEQEEQLILGQATIVEQKEIIAIAAPKVESYDRLIKSESDDDLGTAAKKLKLGRNTFTRLLRENKVIQSGHSSDPKRNVPYQSFLSRNYFTVKTREVRNRFNEYIMVTTTYVTGKGLAWLDRNRDKYLK